MAPLPADDQGQMIDRTTTDGGKTWNTATIIVGAVFLFLLLVLTGTIVAFIIRKRKIRNKLPASQRPRSYHPFRTEVTDKSSLLSDAPTPSEERSIMFSRTPTNVSLYLDAVPEPVSKRVTSQSMETVNLIPLHVTPTQNHESVAGDLSSGSGVTEASANSRYSAGNISLSPSPFPPVDEGDLGVRPSAPRRASTNELRYYGQKEVWKTSNSPHTSLTPQLPQIPRIVRTVSD